MRKVSAIIPTLNEERNIAGAIRCLRSQTHPPCEIIVSDSGSQDRTVSIASRLGAKIVNAKRTIAHGRNAGARAAKGDMLLFLDADTRLPSNFIEKSTAAMQRRGLRLACPIFHPKSSPVHVKLTYHAFNLAFILLYRLLPNGAGTCLLAEKRAFEKTSGFSPSFKFEDAEFIRRAARSHSFGILPTVAHVSDRRFRKYGYFRTLAIYLLLALLFSIGAFRLANKLDYRFGEY